MTLSGDTTPGQSRPGSDGNEGLLRIPQSSSITEASQSDCLVSYPGHSIGESYPFCEMQSVYSTVLVDWAMYAKVFIIYGLEILFSFSGNCRSVS